MEAWQVAQAAEFVRALRFELRKMTGQLASLERLEAAGKSARAGAVRTEAAELRHDIHEARLLVDRLERLYLCRPGPPPGYRRPVS